MAHDWGFKVPADLPTEQVFEIRDKLRSGEMTANFGDTVAEHPKMDEWRREINEQMLVAYEAEASRRRS